MARVPSLAAILELKQVWDQMESGILLVDSHLHILMATRNVQTIFTPAGWPVQERHLLLALQSTDLERLVKQAMENGRLVTHEIQLPYPRRRQVGVRAVPLFSDEGALGCLVFTRDLTELRRLETIRRDFVANVSHELRTPIASVKAMAETLLDGAKDDPEVADDFLNIIEREADRLARIADDLLVLSRAESGEAHPVPLDLRETIHEACSHFMAQAERRRISISLRVPPLPPLLADRDQVLQVLTNLIDNAVKYTPEGGSVWVQAEEQPGMIAIQVGDTGIGIPEQDIARIFERFYRVDKARSRELGGTGLGLSIVKNIVEAHGGRVWAESSVGQGSLFNIVLPRGRDGEQDG